MSAAKYEGGSVLIVDDNPTNLSVLSEYLTTRGLKISISKSGEQALQRVERIKPDLILLDVMMPSGIDGFEVCRRLKANEATQEIPIMFMTALSETVDKVKGFERVFQKFCSVLDDVEKYRDKKDKCKAFSAKTALCLSDNRQKMQTSPLQVSHAFYPLHECFLWLYPDRRLLSQPLQH